MLNIIFVGISSQNYPEVNGGNDFVDIGASMVGFEGKTFYSTVIKPGMGEIEMPAGLNIGLGAGMNAYYKETVGTHNSADVDVIKATSLQLANTKISFNNNVLYIKEGLSVSELTYGKWKQYISNNPEQHAILDVNAEFERTIAKVNLEYYANKEYFVGALDLESVTASARNLEVHDDANVRNLTIGDGDSGIMYKGIYIPKSLYDGEYYYDRQRLKDIGFDVYYANIYGKIYIIASISNLLSVTDGTRYYYNINEFVYEFSGNRYGLKATLSYNLQTPADKTQLKGVINKRLDSFVPSLTGLNYIDSINASYEINAHGFSDGIDGSLTIPKLRRVIPNKLTLNYDDKTLTCQNLSDVDFYDVCILYNSDDGSFKTKWVKNNVGTFDVQFETVAYSDVRYIEKPLDAVYNANENILKENCGLIRGKYVLRNQTNESDYIWGNEGLTIVAYVIENNTYDDEGATIPGGGSMELYYIYESGDIFEYLGTGSYIISFYSFK